jgi:hypothetical protein
MICLCWNILWFVCAEHPMICLCWNILWFVCAETSYDLFVLKHPMICLCWNILWFVCAAGTISRSTWPWSLDSFLNNGYRVTPGGREARDWCWPPTPSSTEVKERVLISLIPVCAFMADYRSMNLLSILYPERGDNRLLQKFRIYLSN